MIAKMLRWERDKDGFCGWDGKRLLYLIERTQPGRNHFRVIGPNGFRDSGRCWRGGLRFLPACNRHFVDSQFRGAA